LLVLAFASGLSSAEDLAVCRNPAGYAYYADEGVVPPKEAGWRKDQISDGVLSLVQARDGSWDILFFNAMKTPRSTKQDGGQVLRYREGATFLTALVVYQDTLEVYTFFKERSGKLRFSQYANKGGPGALTSKISSFVGSCDLIRFDSVSQEGRKK
jgi:hypothetical protein